MTIDQTLVERVQKDLMGKLAESFNQVAQAMDQLSARLDTLTELFEAFAEASKED